MIKDFNAGSLYPVFSANPAMTCLLAGRFGPLICDAIAQILDTVTAQECRNYFAQAGYNQN